mmetsp:Transcript_35026/g.91691  ORF Transcript_35026/g.91691 Transcript_35026/m.91691 type:complete len:262 (+) Transcript_35026:205-990(+)
MPLTAVNAASGSRRGSLVFVPLVIQHSTGAVKLAMLAGTTGLILPVVVFSISAAGDLGGGSHDGGGFPARHFLLVDPILLAVYGVHCLPALKMGGRHLPKLAAPHVRGDLLVAAPVPPCDFGASVKPRHCGRVIDLRPVRGAGGRRHAVPEQLGEILLGLTPVNGLRVLVRHGLGAGPCVGRLPVVKDIRLGVTEVVDEPVAAADQVLPALLGLPVPRRILVQEVLGGAQQIRTPLLLQGRAPLGIEQLRGHFTCFLVPCG